MSEVFRTSSEGGVCRNPRCARTARFFQGEACPGCAPKAPRAGNDHPTEPAPPESDATPPITIPPLKKPPEDLRGAIG